MEEIKKEQKEKGNKGKKKREQKHKFKVCSVLQYSIVGLHNRLNYDLGNSKRRRMWCWPPAPASGELTNEWITSSTPTPFLHIFMASTAMTLYLRDLMS
jgi:hypothetical protein